jgi:dihydrofolate synthase/folylpolyglutamate synthase
MSRFQCLDDWLDWQEQLHFKEIDLGLERVSAVACKLGLIEIPRKNNDNNNASGLSGAFAADSKVVIVAGTNGKGSCIKTIEQGLLVQQNTDHNIPLVGSYTSPHIHHYCERICIDGVPVSEQIVCDAFEAIDQARGDTPLTYFEFGTLAALWVFKQYNMPYVLLEVGLGGRLDAVNIVDADIAVVTSIGIDHQEWLGNDRNVISREKLGIARKNRPLVIGESDLTPNLQKAVSVFLSRVISRDFKVITHGDSWEFHLIEENGIEKNVRLVKADSLPFPSLHLASVATGLCVLQILGQLPSISDLRNLMSGLELAGRYESQWVEGVEVIFDVAHNPAAAGVLAQQLSRNDDQFAKTYAVIAVMADKDHQAIIASLSSQIDHWFLGNLTEVARAATTDTLKTIFDQQQHAQLYTYTIKKSVELAFESAIFEAGHNGSKPDQNGHDRIVVFGSFYTVAAIKSLIRKIYS